MGIVEADLAEFELSAFEDCAVERNADGSVHLHLDALRIELSRSEFDQFAAVVRDARDELRDLKAEDGPHGDTTAHPR